MISRSVPGFIASPWLPARLCARRSWRGRRCAQQSEAWRTGRRLQQRPGFVGRRPVVERSTCMPILAQQLICSVTVRPSVSATAAAAAAMSAATRVSVDSPRAIVSSSRVPFRPHQSSTAHAARATFHHRRREQLPRTLPRSGAGGPARWSAGLKEPGDEEGMIRSLDG